jgi:hypothetical protein
MPCMKCSNGKWKYGVHGRCQFDTLAACKAAAAAIHVKEKVVDTPCNKSCECVCKSHITEENYDRISKNQSQSL